MSAEFSIFGARDSGVSERDLRGIISALLFDLPAVFYYFPDCDPGWYGVNCVSQCDGCVGGNLTCDVVDGTCVEASEDRSGNVSTVVSLAVFPGIYSLSICHTSDVNRDISLRDMLSVLY